MASSTSEQDQWRTRANTAIAGGVNSNVRSLNPHIIVDRAAGARLWDVDGHEYIDYLLGQGPNFLGYAPAAVLEKVLDAQRDGVVYAATHRREVVAAEKLLAILPWAETMRFGNSSSEMVQAALRMSRYATGRRRVLRFHGHYHGWFDNIAIRSAEGTTLPAGGGQIERALEDLVTIEWNDVTAFREAVHAHGAELAAVIMEPMMMNAGAIEPVAGYLQAVREECTARGIVLILDETITGFRLAVGGAAQRFDVRPDLAVYGKAMAAGWPCAALAGRRDLFEGVASGAVVHAGTFNGNTIAAAATSACLDEIADGEVHRRIEETGAALMAGLTAVSEEHDLGLLLQGPPMAFHARFGGPPSPVTRYQDVQASDTARYGRFSRALVGHGVWVAARGIWYVSAAHEQKDVEETLERVADVARTFH